MSTLSNTYFYKNNENMQTVLYYDAKPFILKNIYEILEYRYLIGKTLKYNNISLKPKNWKNLYLLEEKLEKNKLEDELISIEKTFKIFIPNENHDLDEYSLTENTINKNLVDLLHKSNSQRTINKNIPNKINNWKNTKKKK
jgi:hypothetical protein